MKKLLGSLIVVLVVGFSSCGNEKMLSDTATAESLSYEIKKENLSEELILLTDEDINAEFLAKYPNTTLTICPSEDGKKYVMTIDPNGSSGLDSKRE